MLEGARRNERINNVIGHFVPNGHHGVFEGGFVMMCPHERVVKRKGVLVRLRRGRVDESSVVVSFCDFTSRWSSVVEQLFNQ